MITVISGTNRKGSLAHHVAAQYSDILQQETADTVKFLALEDIAHDWFHPAMYEEEDQTSSLTKLQDEYMIPAAKFVFVVSEYNGSFPGSLKLFLDGVSIRNYKPTFAGKKAGLIGVASGRAGGLRALDQLSDVLLHVGTHVMPGKLPISSVKKVFSPEGVITDDATLTALRQHAQKMVAF